MLMADSYNNASPMFLILFLSTNYFLNRPCVYCSLLLAVLVVALFDFNVDWFASPWERIQESYAANQTQKLSTFSRTFGKSASLLASAANTTAEAVLNLAATRSAAKATERSLWSLIGLNWLKEAIADGELRIDCLNAVIRM